MVYVAETIAKTRKFRLIHGGIINSEDTLGRRLGTFISGLFHYVISSLDVDDHRTTMPPIGSLHASRISLEVFLTEAYAM